jgi:N-acetylmuramoyl-L-alanine amidase
MKSILIYFLQSILASGILYGYYHLVLRNKKFHQYNRFYLLASLVISVLIPFLNIPVYFEDTEIRSSVVLQTLQTISSSGYENDVVTAPIAAPQLHSAFDWSLVLYCLYAMAVIILLGRVLLSLKKIRVIISTHPVEELEGIRFVNTMEPGTPYSFFRWLFWNKKIELRSPRGEQIFRHEIFHIQQKHSCDIIFMELLTAVCWINPFFHLIKKELKAIHEFLADQFASDRAEKWEYAELLLMQALNTKQQLVNPFFHNQIKRRIAMITNPKKTSHRYLRKILVLPVAAFVLTLFAFKYKNKNREAIMLANDAITIVVDAGHGGIDPGVKSPDNKYTEAQLNLALSKTIQSLANEYNVNVIMTRESDQLPDGATIIQQGLINRLKIVTKVKPFAFISIHLN